MKTIIRLLSLLSLSALTAAPLARAAEPSAPPPSAPPAATGEHPRPDPAKMREKRERRMQELITKLSLTPAQQAQINAIWDKAEEQGKALRAQGDHLRAQGADLRAKGKDVMKASHDQVRSVLTPEQQKIFDAMPPPGQGRHGQRGQHQGEGGKPAGPPPADSAPGKP